MKQEEKKKTAIITGSGRDIGKETAIILAKKSVNVVICSRTQSEINSVVEHINKITEAESYSQFIILPNLCGSLVYSILLLYYYYYCCFVIIYFYSNYPCRYQSLLTKQAVTET